MGASEAIRTVCTIKAPRLLSLGHMGIWQNSQSRNKDWNYRLEKGFVRLSEAVPHYTERHQSVQEYIKRSTSSCYSFGNYCKLAKHLAFVTGGNCLSVRRLELQKERTYPYVTGEGI